MNGSEKDSLGAHSQVFASPVASSEQSSPRGKFPTLARLNVSSDVSRLLPSHFVKRHRILPFEIENETLHVATSEPGNQRIIDDIRLLSGLEVKEFEAPSA